jgi:hypothetical protein
VRRGWGWEIGVNLADRVEGRDKVVCDSAGWRESYQLEDFHIINNENRISGKVGVIYGADQTSWLHFQAGIALKSRFANRKHRLCSDRTRTI